MDSLSSDVIDNILSNISPWHVLPFRLLNKKWNNIIVSNRLYWVRQMRLYRRDFLIQKTTTVRDMMLALYGTPQLMAWWLDECEFDCYRWIDVELMKKYRTNQMSVMSAQYRIFKRRLIMSKKGGRMFTVNVDMGIVNGSHTVWGENQDLKVANVTALPDGTFESVFPDDHTLCIPAHGFTSMRMRYGINKDPNNDYVKLEISVWRTEEGQKSREENTE